MVWDMDLQVPTLSLTSELGLGGKHSMRWVISQLKQLVILVCTQGLTPSQVTYEKKLVQGRPAQARSLIEVGPNNSVDLLKAHRTMKHIHTTCIVTKLILGAQNLVNCLSLRQWIVSLNNPLPLLEEKNTTPFYLKILTCTFSLKG